MKIKQWLKANKEGAIIGSVFSVLLFSLPAIYSDAETVPGFVEWIGNIPLFGPSQGMWGVLLLFLILGALIGAYIDSKWRPRK